MSFELKFSLTSHLTVGVSYVKLLLICLLIVRFVYDKGSITDVNFILGRVPMRRLVYRVQPLPQSMLPLVWDFGQLNTEVEEMYIRQMVLRYVCIRLLHYLSTFEKF